MDTPKQGKLVYDFGRGVTLRLPAEGNREWVWSHLREGDRMELECAESEGFDEPHPTKEGFVWVGGELLARWCSIVPLGSNEISSRRMWAWETTDVADKYWRLFVRMNMKVFRFLWRCEDPWVQSIYEPTWAGYEKSTRWQQKCFGAIPSIRLNIGGKPHILFEIRRPKEEQ